MCRRNQNHYSTMVNKNLLALLTALVLFTGHLSVSAQDVQHPQNYNRVGISFQDAVIGYPDLEKDNFIGGSLDYIHGFRLNETTPIYFETGASISYLVNLDGWAYGNIAVPLNFAYQIPISNSKISLSPFIGLDLKGNIAGTSHADFDDLREWYVDEDCRSFQIGWHLGVGMTKGKFYFGIACGSDFLKLKKNIDSDNFRVSFGLNI